MRILLSLLLVGTSYCFGQNTSAPATEKYIEVTVTDTIAVVPDQIEYSVTLRNNYSAYEYPAAYDDNTNSTDYLNEMKRKEEEAKLKMEVTEKKLKEFFTREKVNWKENKTDNASPYGYSYNYSNAKSFLVTFKSSKELSSFLDKFPEDIEYNGELVSMRCSNTQKYEDKLLEKIVKKAKAQAQKIAAASGVGLGGMTQYSDNVNEIAKGIEQSIRSLMREAKKYDSYNFEAVVLTKTARVRFAIE